ncbi:MAG: dephospho-CoA kinase [Pirellulales bacterium]
MRIIGVVGGVASGKSLVTKQLQELGAGVLDADSAGHQVLESPAVRRAALGRWGERVFGADGRVDRGALAAVVFGPAPDGPRELKYLEELTHPRIGRLLARQAAELAEGGNVAALVLDAPLLLEAGWEKLCDRIVFVDAPREVRLARALARGWSETQFAARENAQKSLDQKRMRADVIIDNSGSPEATKTHVARFWHSLAG